MQLQIMFSRLIMKIESEIEKVKINFVKNLKVPFREIYLLFDEDGKGYITEEELKEGLSDIESGCALRE